MISMQYVPSSTIRATPRTCPSTLRRRTAAWVLTRALPCLRWTLDTAMKRLPIVPPSPMGWGTFNIPSPLGFRNAVLPGDADHLHLPRSHRAIAVGLPDDQNAIVGLQRRPGRP